MKYKTIFTYLLLLSTSFAYAQDDKNINPEELPAQARFFIRTDFAKKEIVYVVEKEGDKTYEVLTSDSTQFEFRKDGQWISITSPKSPIPTLVIPHQINTEIKKACGPNVEISQIIRLPRGKFDVTLNTGLYLRFNKKFKIYSSVNNALIKQQNQLNQEINKK